MAKKGNVLGNLANSKGVNSIETKKAPKKKKENKELTWAEIQKNWVAKDRYYHLREGETTLARIIKSKRIMWYDPELGQEREVTYTVNQKTPFVDEFKGEPRLGHIIIRDGVLHVPKEQKILQMILSHLHPDLNKVYYERDDEADAIDELEMLDLEYEAVSLARELDLDILEAILRGKYGSEVTKFDSKSLKRNAIIAAKENPELFISLAKDDDLEIINDGIKGVEAGIIKLIDRNTLFTWASNGSKLCKVPFDEQNPYRTLAKFFKTEEGVEIYKSLKKQLELKG